MTKFYCEFLGRFHNIVSETTHKITAISAESKFILFPSEDQDLHFFDIVCFCGLHSTWESTGAGRPLWVSGLSVVRLPFIWWMYQSHGPF